MSVLPSVLLDTLSAHTGLWPGPLAAEGVRRRLEQVLLGLPGEVRTEVLEALADPSRNAVARAMLAGVTVASTSGSRPVGVLAPGCLRMESDGGDPWVLGVLAFASAEHAAGAPGDVDRLVGALDRTFGARRYVLHVRRALPSGYDPDPIARAVHLWLAAIDRGEWDGQHALYEDDEVALELTLTGDRREGAPNRVLTVGPITALERLAGVDAQLMRQTVSFQEEAADLPVVCVLAASERWRMPRGYVEQLLYGTADFVCASGSDAPSYRAGFSPNGRSLYSDPACRNLTSLWWVEPAPGDDPFGFRCWSHDNPWTDHPDRVPAIDGRRFLVVERDAEGARGRRSTVLAVQGDDVVWEIGG